MKRFMRILVVLLVAVSTLMGHSAVVFATSVSGTEGEQAAGTPDKPDAEKTEEEKAKEAYEKELQEAYKLPVQSNEIKGWKEGPGTYGDAAIVMDAGSGAVLYAKNIENKEFPASITKVLTALLAFEYGNMSDTVSITPESLECLGSGYASIGLKEGNMITMDQALNAMLLASSNEVAYAVGSTVAAEQGQDYNWFIEKMNEKCRELGGENSNFINTNGVHNEQHYTCAKDMALIGRELFKYPEFFTICQTQQYTIPACETTEEHIFQQKHEMLIQGDPNYYEYAIGGKTGYTTEANNTLITMADNGEKQLVCVVLKTYAGHVYSDTRELLEYGFNNFSKISVNDNEKSKDFEEIAEGSYVMLPEDVKFKSLDKEIRLSEKGSKEATVTYYYKDMPVGTVDVRVSESYNDKNNVKFVESQVKKEKEDKKQDEKDSPTMLKTVITVVLIAAAVILIILIIRKMMIKKRKQRRRRRRR